MDSNHSPILEFYKNKNIFITGATGFLGKTLIEKLIRSCSDINKIYILIRHKKGKTPTERLIEILNFQVLIRTLTQLSIIY
jgi:fatty acyl-CoA reductase